MSQGYAWLRRIGWHWLFWLEPVAIGLFLLGVVGMAALGVLEVRDAIVLGYVAVLLGLATLLVLCENYLLFNAIRIAPRAAGAYATESRRSGDDWNRYRHARSVVPELSVLRT